MMTSIHLPGVCHLRMAVPSELRHPSMLLQVPAPMAGEIASDLLWNTGGGGSAGTVGAGGASLGGGSLGGGSVDGCAQVFQRAESYFTRCVAEIDQLRTQAAAPSSKDISARETALMLTLSENLFCLLLRTRCVVAAAIEVRRSVI